MRLGVAWTLMLVGGVCGCASIETPPLGLGHVAAWESAEPPPPCPVSGKPANLLVRIVRADGPVYFCCAECIDRFEQDAQGYRNLVEMQRQVLAVRPHVQVTCPINGDPVLPDRYTDLFGERVYFCTSCDSCKDLYEADPEHYAAALEASYTYQTRCPLTGRRIDPRQFVELAQGGPYVYFCSSRCKDIYRAAPARYADSLVAQGVNPNP
jgi:YHS domain-containing protein